MKEKLDEISTRILRVEECMRKKISWKSFLILLSIFGGIFSIFVENRLDTIEVNSKAIGVLEERTSNIKGVVKEGVREVLLEMQSSGIVKRE